MSTIPSYAQAARGQAVSQPSPQLTSSSAPSTADVSGNTSVSAPSVTSNTESRDVDLNAQPDIENGLSKLDSDTVEQGDCNSSTVSMTEQGEKPTQDRETKSRSSQRQGAEKGSRSTSRTSRANEGNEGKKGGRKNKKRAEKENQAEQARGDNVEKPKEPAKPVVLTEAAIPAVNPWIKRAELSKAKVTTPASSVPSSSTVANEASNGPEASEDGVTQPIADGTNGDKAAQKKTADTQRAADSAARRTAPRGARAGDKEDKTVSSLPPVADSSFWPDPKSAASKEQLQSTRKPQEKLEASDKDSQDEAATTRKKTWEKLEINHSVVFETQMPTPRGSKPRGGARGGRESGSVRGTLNPSTTVTSPTTGTSNEKPATAGPPGPKSTATRPRDSSLPTRPAAQASAPAVSKRAPVENGAREQRKSSVSGSQDQSREAAVENPAPSKKGPYTKDIRTENGPLSPDGAQTFPRPQHNDRANGAHPHVNGPAFREGHQNRGRAGFRRGGYNSASSSHAGPAQSAGNGYSGSQTAFTARQNTPAQNSPPYHNQFPQTHGRARSGYNGRNGRNNGTNPAGYPPRSAAAVPEFPAAAPVYAPLVHDYWYMINICRAQIEYYFSLDNLVKDRYMRKFMDGSGYVPVDIIANFARMKMLNIPDQDYIRVACMMSDKLEIIRREDGVEHIRGTNIPTKSLILPEADRVEEARNNGPVKFEVLQFPQPSAAAAYPQAYGNYYDDQTYSQAGYVNSTSYDSQVNGGPVNGHQYSHETQLSAVVPDFAPSENPVTLDVMKNFSTNQIDQLTPIVDSGDAAGAPALVPTAAPTA
ncbi:hypothetical protein QBC38DRAFT_211747 [Podospora fimiseda]|uniref:HTH La-type RNA-binding domain-containing protein n=1 Tax=Podospora fimiseda TaxID=252190 RepID=A0AAN7BP50_9PEZI|nr:hypothetical protein QBC38DRAFT_211747 [Podospora fimiseda]